MAADYLAGIDGSCRDISCLVQMGRFMGADIIMRPRLEGSGPTLFLRLHLLDCRTGALEFALLEQFRPEELETVVENVRQRLVQEQFWLDLRFPGDYEGQVYMYASNTQPPGFTTSLPFWTVTLAGAFLASALSSYYLWQTSR